MAAAGSPSRRRELDVMKLFVFMLFWFYVFVM
jgi:hypothetical protein